MVKSEPLLKVDSAWKAFGATQAVRDFSMEVSAGEVVALVGENGAGKSTLIRLMSGELAPDQGEVWVGGKTLSADPQEARARGIAVIHQELSYVPTMTVAENLLLAAIPRKKLRWLVDRPALKARAREMIRILDETIDVNQYMSELAVGNRQVVEIARAVGSRPAVLLLDEPTAALDAREVNRLFEVIDTLRSNGIAMIYVSHRLSELDVVADRFVVMRDGAVAATHERGVDHDQLVADIVGKRLSSRIPRVQTQDESGGSIEFAVDLEASGPLKRLTLHVRGGQAVGIYGLPGSGVEAIAEAIVGTVPTSGSVQIGNTHLGPKRNPRRCRKAGLVHVPADRRHEGIFPDLAMRTNVALGSMSIQPILAIQTRKSEERTSGPLAKRANVRPLRLSLPVGSLSGGNQQKVMFARWLGSTPRVMVLDQPTRGIDVGAKAQIYDLIEEIRQQGTAVVVISPEPEELMQVCDTIGVVHKGELVGFYEGSDVDEEELVAIAIQGK